MDWNKALVLASRVNNPTAAAVFCAVLIAAVVVTIIFKNRNRLAWKLLTPILILGCLPTLAQVYLASRGTYHVQIVVLGIDGQPMGQTTVRASVLGIFKEGGPGNWEFDLSPQTKPSKGEIVFYASKDDSFLAGESALELRNNYFPTVSIRLKDMPSVDIGGIVVDEHGKSVTGAKVSIVGYPDSVTTDASGNFHLLSHHANGQSLSMRVEKGDETSQTIQFAGQRDVQITLRRN